MSEISKHIGARIRLYRKSKNLTMEQLGKLVNKSKATVSKYETGDISIDVDMLFEISQILNIFVNQLTDYHVPLQKAKKTTMPTGLFHDTDLLYVYFYDGRVNKIVKCVLQIFPNEWTDLFEATLYVRVESFENYHKCNNLYYGQMKHFDILTNFTLQNQSHQIEQIVLNVINPLHQGEQITGLLSGISSSPIFPIAIKCLISKYILPEDEKLMNQLLLSKEDFKNMKQLNMFAVNQLFS